MLRLSGRTRVTQADVDSLFDTFETRTFGQLLREARSLIAVPTDLDTKLAEALRRRNDLAHRFFARLSEDSMSDAGRIEMIDELRNTILLFEEVDTAMTAIREPLSERLGISREMGQKELDSMLARAATRDEGV